MKDVMLTQEVSDKKPNQSIVKLMQLFHTLSESKLPMRLQDLSEAAGMSQATALRYLNALIGSGYVYKDEIMGRYALTWKICRIGNNVRSNLSLRTISGELINDLSRRLGLGVSLVVEINRECLYMDCVYEPDMMGMTLQRIGRQSPMYSTSSGKLFLSRYSEQELEQYIEEKPLVKLTDYTIDTKEKLLAELETVRKNGFALDNMECEENLKCIAFPVYDYTGGIVAAVSCFGRAERFTEQETNKIRPELKKVTAEISFRLGADGE